jgi:hypothetical protein
LATQLGPLTEHHETYGQVPERSVKMSRSSSKFAADNRANQMNPNNSAYWNGRGAPPPVVSPAPACPQDAPKPETNGREEKK